MAFTRKDFATETWARLVEHLNTEIEAARTQLESRSLTPELTASLRGEIAGLRKLLALATPDPVNAPGSRKRGNQVEDEAD